MIAYSALEMEWFVCNCVTSIEIEKLSSKGVMCTYSTSVYYTCTSKSISWVELSKMKVKIKLVLNFAVNNENRFSFIIYEV